MVWISIIQAFVLAVLAAAGVAVAYLQWRTAHHKVIVDLFDRRFAVYQEVFDAIRPVMAKGHAADAELFKFGQAAERARFLFGAEVRDYLENIRQQIIENALAQSLLEQQGEVENRSQVIEKKYDSLRKILAAYNDLPRLCESYLRLDQSLNDGLFTAKPPKNALKK